MIAPNERVARLYEHLGYECVESTWQISAMMPILQFDDFAADATAVRAAVIGGGLSTKQGPDGDAYTCISLHPVPQWFTRIGEVVGQEIRAAAVTASG